jgi:hypothetical protein
MGLYGAMTKKDVATEVYPGIPCDPDRDITLLFSEVDADLHDAVADGTYGSADPDAIQSTIKSVPQYYLINGQAYSDGQPGIPTGDIAATGPAVLRFLNACSESRVPILDRSELTLIAEDGKPYGYPKNRYSIHLPALKTVDALWTPPAPGSYALYDRRLGLVNGMQPTGGMLVHLGVSLTEVNPAAMTIPASGTAGSASPYPSTINLSGVDGTVADVNVVLNGLTHGRSADLDILLVGPGGNVLLMSDRGSVAVNVDVTFDDQALFEVPAASPILPRAYKPTNTGTPDSFPMMGTGPWGSALSVLNGTDPNGAWSLYVQDDMGGPGSVGTLAGGWSLVLTPQ